MKRIRGAAWACALALCLWGGAAQAQVPKAARAEAQAPVAGVVVGVQNGEVILDLGASSGLVPGARVEILRRLEVKHPVTGAVIVDHFPIGELSLDEVGQLLSIARGWEPLSRAPQVGDAARVAGGTPAPSPRSPSAPSRDPAQDALEEVFVQTLGKPLTERASLWELYLARWPQSPWAEGVAQELRWLQDEVDRARRATPSAQASAAPAGLTARVSAPARLHTGEPLEIHAAVLETEQVSQVRLLVRRRGALTFETLPMRRNGDLHWVAQLTEAAWRAPGELEFFVEAVRTDGALETLRGDASAPLLITQDPPPSRIVDEGGRSRAESLFEWVNFKSGEGDDEFLRFETSYRYQVKDWWPISGFRVGVSIFDGEGGSLDEIARAQTRRRAVNAGFAELELSLHDYFGVSGRVSAGNHHQTSDGTAAGVFGLRLLTRIGEEGGTRLDLGGALTGELGNEVWASLTLDTLDRVPLGVSVVATNLPVGGDLGVSLNLSAGWELNEHLALELRTGWNARTINHYGFTGGVGASLGW